jgi:hypothetical protein
MKGTAAKKEDLLRLSVAGRYMKKPQTGRKGNVIRQERDDREHLPPGDTATCRDRFCSTVALIVQEKISQSSRYL